MSLSKLCILLCLPVLQSFVCGAQVCPPNLNFEYGDFTNWQLDTGTCCPINVSPSGPVINRHVLMSGAFTYDAYGSFPVVDPMAGVYSLKLGNDAVGAQAERARYYMKVPKTKGNFMIVYRYAVVFQDPNHTASEQPRFEVSASDSALNTVIACSEIAYVASPNLPGFWPAPSSPPGAPVYYKSWSTASLRIDKQFSGRTIAVDFKTGDCAVGAHFGYAYVDMACSYFQLPCTHILC